MTKNPLFNAVGAALYIGLIASIMYYGPHRAGGGDLDTVLMPIAVLSLFVLSAAMMGYFFVYQPVQLYLDGEKKKAVDLFLKTIGVFAVITAVLLGALFTMASQF